MKWSIRGRSTLDTMYLETACRRVLLYGFTRGLLTADDLEHARRYAEAVRAAQRGWRAR